MRSSRDLAVTISSASNSGCLRAVGAFLPINAASLRSLRAVREQVNRGCALQRPMLRKVSDRARAIVTSADRPAEGSIRGMSGYGATAADAKRPFQNGLRPVRDMLRDRKDLKLLTRCVDQRTRHLRRARELHCRAREASLVSRSLRLLPSALRARASQSVPHGLVGVIESLARLCERSACLLYTSPSPRD